MQAFVLAGGFATRLWPLTEKRAKPLLPLAGKPIVTHLVERIPEGIPVTVSTNAAFAGGFEEWQAALPRQDVRLVIEGSHKDEHKLGALGAVAEWIRRKHIAEDLLLLTGDNYLGFPLSRFLDAARPGIPLLAAYDIQDKEKASAFGTVILAPVQGVASEAQNETNTGSNLVPPLSPQASGEAGEGRTGEVRSEPRRILGFEEKPRDPKTTLVSTGCSLIPKEMLPVLLDLSARKPDNVGGLFEEFLRQGMEVDCFTFTEPWLDIGSFASYLDAHRLLVGQQALFHPEAAVRDSRCLGSIAVGRESVVEGSELLDCIVFGQCKVLDCVLRNCILDDGCELRGIDLSDKMLRAGTVLKQPENR